MSIKVLLVVQDGEACLHYTEVLQRVGVEMEIVPSLDMVGALFPLSAYNGLLVDVPTMIRAGSVEKALLQDLLVNIPTLRLRWDASAKSIRALTTRRQPQGAGTLASFLIEVCGTFPARRIRSHPRLVINYPVLLSPQADFPAAETQKSMTINVSRGGCFVFSTTEWFPGQTVWLQIRGIADPAPIGAEVRWQQMWGGKDRAPGIGLEFKEISPLQREELSTFVQQHLE